MHEHVGFQLTQVLDKIESERVVVVEDENHRRAKYNSNPAWPSAKGKSKFEFYVTQAGGDFVDHAILIGFVLGGEGDAEADRRLGVVPRHGGDEFFADEPLRKCLAIFEFHPFTVGLDRRLGRAHVEEE